MDNHSLEGEISSAEVLRSRRGFFCKWNSFAYRRIGGAKRLAKRLLKHDRPNHAYASDDVSTGSETPPIVPVPNGYDGRESPTAVDIPPPAVHIPPPAVDIPPPAVEIPPSTFIRRHFSFENVDIPPSTFSPPTNEQPTASNQTASAQNTNEQDGSSGLMMVAILVATGSYNVLTNPPDAFKLLLQVPKNIQIDLRDILFFAGNNNSPPTFFYALVLISSSYTVSLGVIMILLWKKSLPRGVAIMTFTAALAMSGAFVMVVIHQTPTFTTSIGPISISSVGLVWIFVSSVILVLFFLVRVDKLTRHFYAQCYSSSRYNYHLPN